MKNRVIITVTVNENREGSYTASIELDKILAEAYAPLDVCTDSSLAYALGFCTKDSSDVEKIVELRKNKAELLANALKEHIYLSMKSRDTINGYPVVENDNI